MPHKILPAARNSIIQIWHYTDQKWGEDQADKYIHGIHETVKNINANKHLWRSPAHDGFEGVFFVRYRHHFIFFRQLSQDVLGVINILHERMNLPDRLLNDLDLD